MSTLPQQISKILEKVQGKTRAPHYLGCSGGPYFNQCMGTPMRGKTAERLRTQASVGLVSFAKETVNQDGRCIHPTKGPRWWNSSNQGALPRSPKHRPEPDSKMGLIARMTNWQRTKFRRALKAANLTLQDEAALGYAEIWKATLR